MTETGHTVEALLGDIAKYRARLEVDSYGTTGPGTSEGEIDIVHVPYSGFDNEETPDGIYCRDATIQLQDEELKEQAAEIAALREALERIAEQTTGYLSMRDVHAIANDALTDLRRARSAHEGKT